MDRLVLPLMAKSLCLRSDAQVVAERERLLHAQTLLSPARGGVTVPLLVLGAVVPGLLVADSASAYASLANVAGILLLALLADRFLRRELWFLAPAANDFSALAVTVRGNPQAELFLSRVRRLRSVPLEVDRLVLASLLKEPGIDEARR